MPKKHRKNDGKRYENVASMGGPPLGAPWTWADPGTPGADSQAAGAGDGLQGDGEGEGVHERQEEGEETFR